MLERSKLYAESWNVAWRKKQPSLLIGDCHTEFHVIKNSFRYWAADPFAFEENNELYIFAELYDYIRRRGILGFYKLTGEKSGKWIPIIVEDFHMSYPCIFRMGADIYIMPEANQGEQLFWYKATEFPYKWEKVKVLYKDVRYADTTPLLPGEYNHFVTYEVTDPYHPKFIYLDTENPDNNQVLNFSNVELRRSAGSPFELNGKIFRPAQNCTDDYGKGLIFYEDTIINESVFEEYEVKRVFSEELTFDHKIFLDGMHTYNISENYEVIDIKTRRLNVLNLLSRFWGKAAARMKG